MDLRRLPNALQDEVSDSFDAAISNGNVSVVQTIAINGRSYRLKDHATAAGKEDKSKKTKSKSNDTSAAEPAS